MVISKATVVLDMEFEVDSSITYLAWNGENLMRKECKNFFVSAEVYSH